ncbi:MAG TPA: hypothetical protein VNT02_13270, partial [Burkholderiales bacterium]|nr:hypothetical protein [Burkholderiales bacterium]
MSTARHYRSAILTVVALACALGAGQVNADKPSWAGGGNKHERKQEGHERGNDRDGRGNESRGHQ